MNKKGFTLIEVLAVVIIMTSVALLVVPNVVNRFSNKKDEIKEVNEELIISNAKIYVKDHENDYMQLSGMEYCIKLKKLVDEGYLNDKIIDVTNNNDIANTHSIKLVADDDGVFDYSLVENDECN